MMKKAYQEGVNAAVLGSIVVSILACHARDRGSIPRRGVFFVKQCYNDYVWT